MSFLSYYQSKSLDESKFKGDPKDIEHIISILNGMGFEKVTRGKQNEPDPTSDSIYVYTTIPDRNKVFSDIKKVIQGDMYYKKDPAKPNQPFTMAGISSSVGALVTNGIKIYVKNIGARSNAGKENELIIIDTINQIIASADSPITIRFKAHNGHPDVILNGVTQAVDASRMTKGKTGNLKADIIIMGAVDTKISLKKNNAEFWESLTHKLKKTSRSLIQQYLDSGDLSIIDHSSVANARVMNRGLAIKMDVAAATEVVFGSDILGNGMVVTETFNPQSFKFDVASMTLNIDVTKIYSNIDQIEEKSWPWFATTANASKIALGGDLRGIEVRAAMKSRVHNTFFKPDILFTLDMLKAG